MEKRGATSGKLKCGKDHFFLCEGIQMREGIARGRERKEGSRKRGDAGKEERKSRDLAPPDVPRMARSSVRSFREGV